MALHNDWDHEVAESLWGTKGADYEDVVEWFLAQVGPCTDYSRMRWENDLHARFVFNCQRGQMEVELRVSNTTGRVTYTLMGARDAEPPPHVRQMAEQIVALANGEPAAEPELAGKLDAAEFHAELDEIAARGSCNVDRVYLGSVHGGRFILECANGPMTMLVQLNQRGALERFGADKSQG